MRHKEKMAILCVSMPGVFSPMFLITKKPSQPGLEHRIVVGRVFRNALENIPVFNDFAVVIEAKNIDASPIGVSRPLLITMQDHVVAFGNDPFELDALSWILLSHSSEVVNEGLLAISHCRVMLGVHLSCIPLHRESRLAFIEHQIIEAHHGLFVAFKLLTHSPFSFNACLFAWTRAAFHQRSLLLAVPHYSTVLRSASSEGASSRSHAPVGHSFGLSMVTAETGYQRFRPRNRTSSCPRLDLTAITCATPQLTRVHG